MLVRTSIPDLNLTSMLPAIDEVIMNKYSQFPEQFSSVFRTMKSDRSIEQTTEVTGLGTFVQKGETEATVYDRPLPGFNKTYTHAQYTLGFKVSKIAMDDDKFGVIRKLATELGRSAKETRELVPANIFNNGFTGSAYAGPDGVALFSTVHPLIGGGTFSNRAAVAADPDVSTLQVVLTAMRKAVDHRGKRLRIPPKKLIVCPEYEFLASELLGGTDRSDTANRAINSFRKRVGMASFTEIMVWDYLTSSVGNTPWFVQADVEDTELRFYNREPFNTVHDTEFDTRAIKTAGWMRFSVGFNGAYGIYGVPGS